MTFYNFGVLAQNEVQVLKRVENQLTILLLTIITQKTKVKWFLIKSVTPWKNLFKDYNFSSWNYSIKAHMYESRTYKVAKKWVS